VRHRAVSVRIAHCREERFGRRHQKNGHLIPVHTRPVVHAERSRMNQNTVNQKRQVTHKHTHTHKRTNTQQLLQVKRCSNAPHLEPPTRIQADLSFAIALAHHCKTRSSMIASTSTLNQIRIQCVALPVQWLPSPTAATLTTPEYYPPVKRLVQHQGHRFKGPT
jgi:hypothetical protein